MIIDLSHIDGMVLFGSVVLTVASYCLLWYHGARTATKWVNREWQESAIARNVARYHPQTGKWEWTVEPDTSARADVAEKMIESYKIRQKQGLSSDPFGGNQILEKQA